VDPAALTGTVLEVLPVVPPLVAQQLVGLLPEVATPEEHEVGEAWGMAAGDCGVCVQMCGEEAAGPSCAGSPADASGVCTFAAACIAAC
jgi:hypothetical protein